MPACWGLCAERWCWATPRCVLCAARVLRAAAHPLSTQSPALIEMSSTMRPIRETIPLEEALAVILDSAAPIVRTERIPLRDATGRVVAAPAVASADVPPFDRAAMDGYAVVAEDTFGAGRYEPKVLRCVEKVYTGQMPDRAITRGECVEI